MDARTPWRGQRDTTRRALAKLLAFSLLLHLPLTPWAGVLGLIRAFAPSGQQEEAPDMTAIPIDIIEEEGPSTPPPAAPEPVAAPPAAPAEAKKEPEQPKPEKDAGAPDSAPNDADTDADAGLASDAGAKDPGLRDPIAFRGAARRVVDPNANVKLQVYTSRIRKHPLGGRVGKLLGSVYQWRDFFGPAGLDPIRDVDQILVVGPQFRDSSKVVAALKLNVSDELTRQAIDALVQADTEGGRWVEDAGAPVAIAHADRAERVFVLAGRGVVVVVPPHLQEQAVKAAKPIADQMRDGRGAEVVVATIKTPWRALRGMFNAPKSIKQAKAHVIPTAERGAEIIIEAEDESPELATENAAYLESAVTSATQLDLGFFGALIGAGETKFVDKIEFSAEGSTIHGRLVLTEKQILMLMDMVGAYIGQPRPKKRVDAGAPSP